MDDRRDARGIEHAALAELIAQIRRLRDVSGCAFQAVDLSRRVIHPVATWFADDDVRAALEPVLTRPYDRDRPGVTEGAIEADRALLIRSLDEWPGAAGLRERLHAAGAMRTWEWYRRSSFVSCPVRTPSGATLGVLTISTTAPQPPLGEEDLRVVEAMAGVAALALERAERVREERALNAAIQEVGASLEPDAVYRALIEQATLVTGAPKVALARWQPSTQELVNVAVRGMSDAMMRRRFKLGEGKVGEVAQSRRPYLSQDADAARFHPEMVEHEGVRSFAHVPVSLGGRLFGVLSVGATEPGAVDDRVLRRLEALARAAAGAIANALDFQRERRIALALTRGFVAGPAPALSGIELGLVYEPVGREVVGGDVFGAWRLPSGAAAVLVGDVAGKGLEVAALSAMVRFFVEARTWDTEDPAAALAQADALLASRLPAGSFASAFMAVIDGATLRWANAGHAPPQLLRAAGGIEELSTTGLPLGVEAPQPVGAREIALGPRDVLFAATDGLYEARRDGRFFGSDRLPALLAQHGAALAPAELVAVLRREVEAWAPRLEDDIVVLAVRRCSS